MSETTKIQHTPGPWRFETAKASEKDGGGTLRGVFESRGYTIAPAVHGANPNEADANARLIAKAPELLLFVRNILSSGALLCESGAAQDFRKYAMIAATALLDEIDG